MLKKIVVCALIFTSHQTFAQSSSFIGGLVDRIHFGIKAGGNYSNFLNANFKTDGLAGFHAGGIVTLDMGKHLVVQEEFLYSTLGAKVANNVFGQEDVRLDYFSVPILFKYRTGIGLYAELGTQADFLISDHKLLKTGDFAEKLDFGAVGGLGYRFAKHYEIGLRYYYGLKNVGKFEGYGVAKDFKNSTAQMSFAYMF